MPSYEELIPIARPSIGKDELAEVEKVFTSNWLGLGAWVMKFEDKIRDYLGADNAIAVNTGTTALHLALEALGVGRGDKVIVPSLTFAASVQAICMTKAEPVFCDVEEDTLNMDVDDVEKKVSSGVKAIMPVHYRGLSCDMDRILDLAAAKNVRVVEDAAHAFGSVYKDRKIGSFGDVTCFSFDPIKIITCGEGGAITTSDKKLAQLIYKKRILGIDKDTWSRYKHRRDWFYTVSTLGFRYHMSNINAAIGLVQFEKIDRFILRRRQIAKRYDDTLAGLKGVTLLKSDHDNMVHFNYILRVKNDREKLMGFLKKRKIDSGVHYIPNHLQPFFRKFKSKLPVTEKVWKELLTLPLYYDMTDEDVGHVIDSIKEFYA